MKVTCRNFIRLSKLPNLTTEEVQWMVDVANSCETLPHYNRWITFINRQIPRAKGNHYWILRNTLDALRDRRNKLRCSKKKLFSKAIPSEVGSMIPSFTQTLNKLWN